MVFAVGAVVIALSTALQAHSVKVGSECESGMLDPGDAGLNVLVYDLCHERLTIGFASSDMLEEVACMPNGHIRLWRLVGNARCARFPASDRDQVHELWEPLKSVDRSTRAPVRQLLLCRAGMMPHATIIVPDARDALLEINIGDTKYESVTRRFISACLQPIA